MKKGLQPLIDKFLRDGLLVLCRLCTTLLLYQLLSQMGNTGWYKTLGWEMRQQSLYIPLQPILMLVQIPGDVKWFTVLDCKDACFSIWFISHFSYLFAFE